MIEADYSNLLVKFNNFEECILLDYWSENLCRDFTVLVNNIWEEAGEMRSELDTVAPVYLQFYQCQRISIENAFSSAILNNPEAVDWGLNEFSLITVKEIDTGWFRFSILWEDSRRIEIDCRTFQIKKGILPAERRDDCSSSDCCV